MPRAIRRGPVREGPVTLEAVALAAVLAVAGLLLGGLIVWVYLRDRRQERPPGGPGPDTPPEGVRSGSADGPPR